MTLANFFASPRLSDHFKRNQDSERVLCKYPECETHQNVTNIDFFLTLHVMYRINDHFPPVQILNLCAG